MSTLIQIPSSELMYAQYQERQHRETTKKQLAERAVHLKKANHFAFENKQWKGLSYEGYAVVSMLNNNPANEKVSQQLQDFQFKLTKCFINPSSCFLLPPDSFHQTVANTLSDNRFRENVVMKKLEKEYPTIIKNAFNKIPQSIDNQPIAMRLIGLSLFSSAIGILGVFESENDFNRILTFREHFYDNPDLHALTIQRTRPFIGHITLAYLENELSREEKARLITTCDNINRDLEKQQLYFNIYKTELRNYLDLSCFNTQPHYPVYSFINNVPV